MYSNGTVQFCGSFVFGLFFCFLHRNAEHREHMLFLLLCNLHWKLLCVSSVIPLQHLLIWAFKLN